MNLVEYKGYGHQLLKLVSEARGITINETYALLAKTLGVKKKYAHFSNMGWEETTQAVIVLKKMLRGKTANQKRKAEIAELYKANKSKPYSEILAAVRALPKRKKLPFWVRWGAKLKKILTTNNP